MAGVLGELGVRAAGDVEEALGPEIGTALEILVFTCNKAKNNRATSSLAD